MDKHKTLEKINAVLMTPEKGLDMVIMVTCGLTTMCIALTKAVLSPLLALPRTFGWYARTHDPRYREAFERDLQGKILGFLWSKYLDEVKALLLFLR